MFNVSFLKSNRFIPQSGDLENHFSNLISKLISIENSHSTPNQDYIDNISSQIMSTKIVLGSPIIKNLLNENAPVNSCTIIPVDFRKNINELEQLIKPYGEYGIGTGIDLDEYEDSNEIEILEKVNSIIDELIKKGYSHRLCAMATLSIESKHIKEFINLKRNKNYSNCHYNISVKIPDSFMQNLTKEKEELLDMISDSIHHCAEPGIIFTSRFDETNPLPNIKYCSVAPCAEIAMAKGEVCQFSYVNLSLFINKRNDGIDYDSLKNTVFYLTRTLDNLIDISIKNSIYPSDIIADKRRIGLGVCGFADLLAKLNIPYDIQKAFDLGNNLMNFINYCSKYESMILSKERGPFRKYKESRYMNESFLNRFINEKITSVSKEQWEELKELIKVYGIRNSSTTAIPPTGNSASAVGASYSIEPYFNYDEYKHKFKVDIVDKNVLKTATDIDPEDHIGMTAVFNANVDDSVSKTVNLPNDYSPLKIKNLIKTSYNEKLNGITMYRKNSLEERNVDYENHDVKKLE